MAVVLLMPGEELVVKFVSNTDVNCGEINIDMDGWIKIDFQPEVLTVSAEFEDSVGRSGEIYMLRYGADDIADIAVVEED